MIIMKRNGSEEQFNVNKIISAISRANAVDYKYELTDKEIHSIADDIQSESEIEMYTICSRYSGYGRKQIDEFRIL